MTLIVMEKEYTRVEKINEAIRWMFIDQEMSVRTIQRELKRFAVELTLCEILVIIASFNYKPVQERALSIIQVRRKQFRKIIEPLIRVASREKITNRRLTAYCNLKGITYPYKDVPFTHSTFESLLASYEFKYPRASGSHKHQIQDDDLLRVLIEGLLTPKELKNLEEWPEVNKIKKLSPGETYSL